MRYLSRILLCGIFSHVVLLGLSSEVFADEPQGTPSGETLLHVEMPDDPSLPTNFPDKYAWMLFLQVNQEAARQYTFEANGKEYTTNSAVWEMWADDGLTFPKNPDPAQPPQWPAEGHVKNLVTPAKSGLSRGQDPHTSSQFILDTGSNFGEEVHRNQVTFDYIIKHNLWYTQGIAAFYKSGEQVVLPTDSIEVKGNWIPISEQDKDRFHWNYNKDGKLFGLIAMHITSKALPNWFWCTFEWVDNPGRCDYIGCHDCFGMTEEFQHIPSHEPEYNKKTGALVKGNLNEKYPAGKLSDDLLALFAANKMPVTGSWGKQLSHYRLKGSQIDFTDAAGRPLLLGNSVTEAGFVPTASCMTCHSRAAVTAAGESAFPLFGQKQNLPLQQLPPVGYLNDPQTGQIISQYFLTYNGPPDPNWFYQYTVNGAKVVNLQTDFVWAIPFKAQPAKEK